MAVVAACVAPKRFRKILLEMIQTHTHTHILGCVKITQISHCSPFTIVTLRVNRVSLQDFSPLPSCDKRMQLEP